jgi:hypothetical protein
MGGSADERTKNAAVFSTYIVVSESDLADAAIKIAAGVQNSYNFGLIQNESTQLVDSTSAKVAELADAPDLGCESS